MARIRGADGLQVFPGSAPELGAESRERQTTRGGSGSLRTAGNRPQRERGGPRSPVLCPWDARKPDAPRWTEAPGGCHIWTGTRARNGYARVWFSGHRWLVHRLRYELEIGPIPDGLELDHYVCDNGHGGCCNPHHCRPVSHRENMLRGNTIAAAHAAKTHCPKGHEFTPDNLVPNFLRRGWRLCRICRNENQRDRRATKKAANTSPDIAL